MSRTPGSGKPKGYKAPKTLEKEAAREFVRVAVTQELAPMIEAQVAHAKGLSYLVARHTKTGKFVRLTEELTKAIVEGTDTEHETIEVWSKDPSTQAFVELLNRALDKAKEQPQDVKVTIEDVASILRRREPKAKPE